MKIKEDNLLQGRRVLVAASGSIAAVKTPLLISSLIKAGAEVRCVITSSASHLVSPLSLATLSRHRCYQDEDQWNPIQARPLHISLAEWAEILVIAPLSASSLARWSQGIGEGLLGSILLAYEGPVIAAAAMNTAMWSNPAVKKNWEKLLENPKVLPLNPSEGILACDRIGEGKMVPIELIQLAITSGIMQKLENGNLKRDWSGKKLLVTAGPTEEALDPARIITNKSSGYMGVLLAQAANLRGAQVDLVHGPLKVPAGWLEGLTTHPVKTAKDMQERLSSLQFAADAISMTAAVADIRKTGGAETNKISKDSLLNSLNNSFEKVPDLLAELASNRPRGQILLGFSALTGNDSQIETLGKNKRLLKGCDLMLANPIDRPEQGFGNNCNGGFLLGPNQMVRRIPITSKLALAHQLLDAILEIGTKFSNNS